MTTATKDGAVAEVPATRRIVVYEGLNRRGAWHKVVISIDRSGCQNVADLVEAKYRAGWRSLRVTLDGRLAGAIEPHPSIAKRRIYWGER